MNKIIDGKKIQSLLKEEYKKKISDLSDKLKLVVIQVGDDSASDVYVRNKALICEEVGISFVHKKFSTIKEEELIDLICSLNADKEVTGILVQLPLPDYIDADKVINYISPVKDVDGLTNYNMGMLFSSSRGLTSCTALGVMKALDYINIPLEGANVAIVGRSKLVGLPLSLLLIAKDANVSVYHSKTKCLKEKTSLADILIVATGKKCMIDSSYVKKDAVVIDVGINKEDGKIYGDCDRSIYDKCKYITPVPGGVGPLTVIMLVNNILEAYYLQK